MTQVSICKIIPAARALRRDALSALLISALDVLRVTQLIDSMRANAKYAHKIVKNATPRPAIFVIHTISIQIQNVGHAMKIAWNATKLDA